MSKELLDIDEAKREATDLRHDDYGAASTDSAVYAHTILPKLRALAGYEDAGHGTYTVAPEGVDDAVLSERLDELTSAYLHGET